MVLVKPNKNGYPQQEDTLKWVPQSDATYWSVGEEFVKQPKRIALFHGCAIGSLTCGDWFKARPGDCKKIDQKGLIHQLDSAVSTWRLLVQHVVVSVFLFFRGPLGQLDFGQGVFAKMMNPTTS